MTSDAGQNAPSHSVTTSAPTPDEARVMKDETKQGVANWGCLGAFCAGLGYALWLGGGWIAGLISADATRTGNVVGALLGVVVFARLAISFGRSFRRESERAKSAKDAGVVEEIRVQHASRAVQWEGLHSSMDPAICIDIGGGRLLRLLGQWMHYREKVFRAPTGAVPEQSDEADEKYVNGMPPPWSFPSTTFTMRRVPETGTVLSVRVEGAHLEPTQSDFDFESLRLDDMPRSSILEGTLADLGSAVRRGSPPLFVTEPAAG
ncbi:MAG: hypothetical protein K8T90_07695 [Planctomycetes bacterium]|nr:hypothetical protein [Planctomycetota bacterium]